MTHIRRVSSGLILSLAIISLAGSCESSLVEARAGSLGREQVHAPRDRAAALVAEGVTALERGDTAAARSAFERALEVDLNNVAALTYLGALADRAGSLTEAEKYFAAAARAAPNSPTARNNYGAVLLRLGRTEQAAAEFEASLKLDQKQLSALVNLGQIYFARSTHASLRAALQFFERARAIAPDAAIMRSLVIIALRLGDREAATAYYRDYAARVSGAASEVSQPAARAELGAALLEAGLISEALAELEPAAAADPSNTNALIALARTYVARDDIRAAGRLLEGAVARGIEAAPIYALLAEIYERSGHVENAIPAMRLAIERDPQNEFYRFRYGMLLTDTGAPAAAVIRLRESLEMFPRSARLWFALGIAHFTDQKNEEAAQAFSRALELDPKFAPALAYLGMMRAEVGQYAEALALYERAIAADQKLGVAHYLAAEALLKEMPAGAARAEAHLMRAVTIDPAFAPARLSLAKLYMRTERLSEAVREFERVVALDPNLAEAHYQLGRAYTRLKRTSDAQIAFATFRRLSERQREQSQNERREVVRRLANVSF